MEGNLSMTMLCNSTIREPLWRAQVWACDHLSSLDCVAGDPRLAVVTLLTQSLNAAGNSIVENILGRAWRGARFAERLTAADTMVAAGGR
jgi:hypothetical protein